MADYYGLNPFGVNPYDPYDRSVPAAIRTNNPGAMWPGPSAKKFGAFGSQDVAGNNKIAMFNDPVAGAAAQFDLLANNYSGLSLRDAIRKWSGGNSSDQYASNVASAAGLSPDTILTPEIFRSPQGQQLAKAMARQESGRDYPMTDEQWSQAQTKAFNGSDMPYTGQQFGQVPGLDPNDPTSPLFTASPRMAFGTPIGGAHAAGAPPAVPTSVPQLQPPNMRYSKLADALLASAAVAKPTGWGSALNALGDLGLGYSLANRADTQQQDYRAKLGQALFGVNSPETIANTLIASGDPELMKAGVTAKLSPKVQVDRFKVDPNSGRIYDTASGQFVDGQGGTAATAGNVPVINGQPLGGIAQKAAEKAKGEAVGKAQADLPRALQNGEDMIQQLDETLRDPGVPSITGTVQGSSYLPGWVTAPVAHYTGAAQRAQGRLSQIQGQAFLQAFNTLRGGGQITEREGEKATAALNRLHQQNMDDADYRSALKDFRSEVVRLYDLAQAKAGVPTEQRKQIAPLEEPKSPSQQDPLAQARDASPQARNPQTGQIVEYNEQTGQWEPVQ